MEKKLPISKKNGPSSKNSLTSGKREQPVIVVVGAGASGMIAAGTAASLGARVVLVEKTERPGKKILLSGKSRCNLTNTKGMKDFISMYGDNGPFLYGAFHHFFRDELLEFLKKYGVATKVERGGRIFPVSDQAKDIVTALQRHMGEQGVELRTGISVNGIQTVDDQITGVKIPGGFLPADAIILATGGASYPGTGSTGDGYRMAIAIGHKVTKLRPALVPLVVEEISLAKSMQGLSLRNVRLTAFRCHADKIDTSLIPTYDTGRGLQHKQPAEPVIESRMGEMMITHFGIGGPVTLLVSLAVANALEKGPVSVSIDLKPSLTRDQLRARLQRDFDQYGKRTLRRILLGLLPGKMIDPFITTAGISPDLPGHQVSAARRERLMDCLKSLRFNIKSPLPLASAIVTAGGISLKEIDPRTMASRLISGLFFCGEVIDIDADTGGYNLQAAFSTGYLAGKQATAYVSNLKNRDSKDTKLK